MSAGFVQLVVLAVLALLLPVKAVAGPPKKVSGAMTFDTIADDLRKYHKQTDVRKRMEWLTKLAVTRDIRVQVTLLDAIRGPSNEVSAAALCLLASHYFGVTDPRTARTQDERDSLWRRAAMKFRHWKEDGSEADLRRRARQLPQ